MSRSFCSCFLISPVGSLAAKSAVSYTWRSSTSVWSNGARFSHSIASSRDFTCHSQKPATSSFVSANGPSITVFLFPSNRTRAPFEETEVEIRQIFEADDFGANLTPELRKQEERLRAQVDQKKKK